METNSTQAVSADTTVQPAPVKRLKKGVFREDGMVFWGYHRKAKNGEWWMPLSTFETKKALRGQYIKKRRIEVGLHQTHKDCRPLFRRGHVRQDGFVFRGYNASCKNGEYWVTQEQYDAHIRKINARIKERRANDPLFALKIRLRSRASTFLRRKGFRKDSKTEAMLGCTYEEFKAHIESRFLPGMSWSNMPLWHVDHHTPLGAAVTEEDVYSLNHFTNLRPMWGADNIAKSSKLPLKHELPENLHPKVREIWERAASNAPGTPNHQE